MKGETAIKNYKSFRLVICLGLILFLLTACSAPAATQPTAPALITATPELSTETIKGEISEFTMLGQMNQNFTGSFAGVSFKLKEQPERIFNLHVVSWDEAIALGIMSKDSKGFIQFEDLVGWKVEIVCEKNEEEGGGYKVITFIGEGLPPTSANSVVSPNDSSTVQSQSTSETPLSNEYIVKPLDSCASIALLFNIPQESLIELNDLAADCSDLTVGQNLIIPAPVP